MLINPLFKKNKRSCDNPRLRADSVIICSLFVFLILNNCDGKNNEIIRDVEKVNHTEADGVRVENGLVYYYIITFNSEIGEKISIRCRNLRTGTDSLVKQVGPEFGLRHFILSRNREWLVYKEIYGRGSRVHIVSLKAVENSETKEWVFDLGNGESRLINDDWDSVLYYVTHGSKNDFPEAKVTPILDPVYRFAEVISCGSIDLKTIPPKISRNPGSLIPYTHAVSKDYYYFTYRYGNGLKVDKSPKTNIDKRETIGEIPRHGIGWPIPLTSPYVVILDGDRGFATLRIKGITEKGRFGPVETTYVDLYINTILKNKTVSFRREYIIPGDNYYITPIQAPASLGRAGIVLQARYVHFKAHKRYIPFRFLDFSTGKVVPLFDCPIPNDSGVRLIGWFDESSDFNPSSDLYYVNNDLVDF